MTHGAGGLGTEAVTYDVHVGVSQVAVVVQVLTLVSHGFSIFQGQLAGAVVGILIAGGILYYLLRPHVKAAFGRS